MDLKDIEAKLEAGEISENGDDLPVSEPDKVAENSDQLAPVEDETPETEQSQETETEAKSEPTDYKALYEAERQKRVAAGREALKLKAKNKKLEAEKAEAVKVEEVTDDQLKSKYKDWDDMTEGEQKALRRAENAERRAAAAENARAQYTEIDARTEEIDDFLDLAEAEGKFPDVREQAEEFKKFARENDNRHRDIEELAKIFTFDHPHQAEAKKASLPFGNSGRQSETTKPKKIGWQQAAELRRTNPRKYEELLMNGKLGQD